MSGRLPIALTTLLLAQLGPPACQAPIPAAPTCSDGRQNRDETGVDCGGWCGATCLVGERCGTWSDCLGGTCGDGRCAGDPCAGDPCYGRGSCDASGVCACAAGYGGPRCDRCEPGVACDLGPGLRAEVVDATSSEAGDAAAVRLRLNAAPSRAVVVTIASERPNEARPSVESVTITPRAWWHPVELALIGRDDGVDDGDQPYAVVLEARSEDPTYEGLSATVVGLSNKAGRCGNGLREAAEACDEGVDTVSEPCDYGDAACLRCSAQCQAVTRAGPHCGDGLLQPEHEACDGGAVGHCSPDGGGVLACGVGCRPRLRLERLLSVAVQDADPVDAAVAGSSPIVAQACDDGTVWTAFDGVLTRYTETGTPLVATSVSGTVVGLAPREQCGVTVWTAAPAGVMHVQGDGLVAAGGLHATSPPTTDSDLPTGWALTLAADTEARDLRVAPLDPGRVLIVGEIRGAGAAVGDGQDAIDLVAGRGWDLFVVEFDTEEARPIWGRVFGGPGDDVVTALAHTGSRVDVSGVSDGGMRWTACAGGAVPRPGDGERAVAFVASIAVEGWRAQLSDPCEDPEACPEAVEVPAGRNMSGCAPDDPRCAPDEVSPAVPLHVDAFTIERRASAADAGAPGATWDEARAACEARGLGLCSAGQWQKAARGTDLRVYPWGRAEPGAVADVSPYGVRGLVSGRAEWLAERVPDASARRYEIRGGGVLAPGSGDLRLRVSARSSADADDPGARLAYRCCSCPPEGCSACDDGVMNGSETGVDCGGSGDCPRCGDGETCVADSDCAGVCVAGTCAPGVYGWEVSAGEDAALFAFGSQCENTCFFSAPCDAEREGERVFVLESLSTVLSAPLGSTWHGTTAAGKGDEVTLTATGALDWQGPCGCHWQLITVQQRVPTQVWTCRQQTGSP